MIQIQLWLYCVKSRDKHREGMDVVWDDRLCLGRRYFPTLRPVGPTRAQTRLRGAGGGFESTRCHPRLHHARNVVLQVFWPWERKNRETNMHVIRTYFKAATSWCMCWGHCIVRTGPAHASTSDWWINPRDPGQEKWFRKKPGAAAEGRC